MEAIASWSVESVRGQCAVEGKLSSKMLRLELLRCAFPMVSWFMFVMISDKSMRTGEDAVAVKRERVERLLASEAKAEEQEQQEEEEEEEEEAKRRRGEGREDIELRKDEGFPGETLLVHDAAMWERY